MDGLWRTPAEGFLSPPHTPKKELWTENYAYYLHFISAKIEAWTMKLGTVGRFRTGSALLLSLLTPTTRNLYPGREVSSCLSPAAEFPYISASWSTRAVNTSSQKDALRSSELRNLPNEKLSLRVSYLDVMLSGSLDQWMQWKPQFAFWEPKALPPGVTLRFLCCH